MIGKELIQEFTKVIKLVFKDTSFYLLFCITGVGDLDGINITNKN